MSYDIYRYMFFGSAALALVMLVVTLILFITLKIPYVIGDLTGINARKGIAAIRSRNEESGVKTYDSSPVNRERGKITDKISAPGQIMPKVSADGGAMRTEKIGTEHLRRQAQQSAPTYAEVAEGMAEHSNQEPVYAMSGPADETSVLAQDGMPLYGQTSVLAADDEQIFQIEFEIRFVHSDMVIT